MEIYFICRKSLLAKIQENKVRLRFITKNFKLVLNKNLTTC